jgi:hypothetical protein
MLCVIFHIANNLYLISDNKYSFVIYSKIKYSVFQRSYIEHECRYSHNSVYQLGGQVFKIQRIMKKEKKLTSIIIGKKESLDFHAN